MPADKQVKLWHQIVFLFIPFVNIWAFYRIQKLSKAALYIGIPSFIFNGITKNATNSIPDEELLIPFMIVILLSIPLTVWAIYLMRKWTLFWNLQFPDR